MNNKKIKTVYTAIYTIIMCFVLGPVAYAAGPVDAVNNLINIMVVIVRTIGLAIGIWSLIQIGLSWQNHDAGQRSQGFLGFAGALVIIFAKEIMDLIIG